MFAKFAAPFLSVIVLATSVASFPMLYRDNAVARRTESYPSFNNWGGHQSMDNFDNFYGSDNFSGSISSVTVVEQETEVVCHSVSIEIIQQRLVVLQEMAKKIITEQICEVETQTIVFQQFTASVGHFSGDLRRYSGHQVGYDSQIASHYNDFYNSDGSLSTSDWGFSGSDVGSNYVVPSGNNWQDSSSHASVDSAYGAAKSAYVSTH